MRDAGQGFILTLPFIDDPVSFHVTDSPLDRLTYVNTESGMALEILTKDGRVYVFDLDAWAWTYTETMP